MFTEVHFELGDPLDPLSRWTTGGGHVVYRPLLSAAGRHRASLSVHVADRPLDDLLALYRQAAPGSLLAPLASDGSAASLLVDAPLVESSRAPSLAPLAALWRERHAAILDPVVAHRGMLRVRALVTRSTSTHELLRTIQESQRACGFSDLRIGRVAPLAPSQHLDLAHRPLPPEQESLVGLAAAMGYYASPKRVTLDEIARAVGLSISPVHKRLKSAEEAIVANHVRAAVAAPGSRRARGGARPQSAGPWELRVRIAGGVGPSATLGHLPGTRAAIHFDESIAPLLVLVASAQEQEKILSSLDGTGLASRWEPVEVSASHAVGRLGAPGPDLFGWWPDVWGDGAMPRSVVIDGGEVQLRALVTDPACADQAAEKLDACAERAGWSAYELLSLRSHAFSGDPPQWPTPLTQRQVEVLRVAHALGYYRTPRGCTLEHVARTLDVSANAVHKNLVLAEAKLIASYLAAGL